MDRVVVPACLSSWFDAALSELRASASARAYVVGTLSRFGPADAVGGSLVLEFARARETGSFALYQRVADHVLWASSLQPPPENAGVVESVGRLSYYACFRLVNKQWAVYEELADDLPKIARGIRCRLLNTRNPGL